MPTSTPIDALSRREAALDLREQRLDAREERLEKREAQIQQREDRLLVRENRLFEQERRKTSDGPKTEPNVVKNEEGTSQKDSLKDVMRLLSLYRLSGGEIPPGLIVEEVVAMKEAATQYQDQLRSLDAQISELKERLNNSLTPFWADHTNKAINAKITEREKALSTMNFLMESFTQRRDKGMQCLTPNMLKSVDHFDAIFEESICQEEDGETTLRRIGEHCAKVTTKGNDLRQPLPSATPATSLHTLLLLLERASHAGPHLQRLADRAIAGRSGCVVLPPPEPTKSIARAMEKVFNEYKGDYTRLLDYVRTTIICNTLVELEEVLVWLCSDAAFGFSVARIKDRISRESDYDPEISGGNRDVMLNGSLDIGLGRTILVEIQLHLRPIFQNKADLHVLYDGVRILGSSYSHEGTLSDKVFKRMEQGVLKDMKCQASKISADDVNRLSKILQTEPNPIQAIDLAYSTRIDTGMPALSGWTIERFIRPSTGTIACRRLKVLGMVHVGLVGPISSALKQCRVMESLHLTGNFLEGPIPDWLSEMPRLQNFNAFRNMLSGTVDVVSKFSKLKSFVLHDNCLEGEIPASALPALSMMRYFSFGKTGPEEIGNLEAGIKKSHYQSLMKSPTFGNSRLRISTQNKDELCRMHAEVSRCNPDSKRCQLQPDDICVWPALTDA